MMKNLKPTLLLKVTFGTSDKQRNKLSIVVVACNTLKQRKLERDGAQFSLHFINLVSVSTLLERSRVQNEFMGQTLEL